MPGTPPILGTGTLSGSWWEIQEAEEGQLGTYSLPWRPFCAPLLPRDSGVCADWRQWLPPGWGGQGPGWLGWGLLSRWFLTGVRWRPLHTGHAPNWRETHTVRGHLVLIKLSGANPGLGSLEAPAASTGPGAQGGGGRGGATAPASPPSQEGPGLTPAPPSPRRAQIWAQGKGTFCFLTKRDS